MIEAQRLVVSKYIKQYLRYFLVWSIAMALFNVIRRVGTLDSLDGEIFPQMTLIEVAQFTVPLVFMLSFLTMISQKILSAQRTMQMSFGKIIALTFFLDLVILVIVFIAAYRAVNAMGFRELAPSNDVFLMMFGKNVLIAGLYITLVNALIHSTRLVNTALGRGNLWKLIRGSYHRPKEEKYIFLFLDLQSSTTAAEQLGHLTYSRMIQECFYDLTMPLQRYEGDVYQYVGDEVVIMWAPKKGLDHANCIRLFFEFDSILDDKKHHFLQKYGWHPQFKAGIHMGPTIATQVGYVKREIAFHGDTLNTAARILSLCNPKGAKFLVSDYLKNELVKHGPTSKDFQFKSQGLELLRGKDQEVEIYEVIENK